MALNVGVNPPEHYVRGPNELESLRQYLKESPAQAALPKRPRCEVFLLLPNPETGELV